MIAMLAAQVQESHFARTILEQGGEISRKLDMLRQEKFPPNAQKTLRSFSLAEVASFVGVSQSYIKKLHLEGRSVQPLTSPTGRRSYTAEQMNKLRDDLDRNPRRRGGERLKVIAVVNFKGGSGKTTTAAHLAQYLALTGHRVLAVDLDPQASLTALHGIQPEIDRNPSFYNSLRYDHERKPLSEVIQPTNFPNLNIVPANLELQEYEYDTPIAIRLLRPHPAVEGRYQVVFGHRRVKVAMHLGRPVRAVVKFLADIDHVIAQGQENSARENLSFIEKSVFSQQLLDLGFDRQIIQSSLSVDAPMLTRMLSVTKRIPDEVIKAVGAAKAIGRDRWIELTSLIERPGNPNKALDVVKTNEFKALESNERFNVLYNSLNLKGNSARKSIKPKSKSWTPADKSVAATITNTGASFNLALKSKDAGKFGTYISDNLDALYRAFREAETKKTGG